jgi:hypothetical protein
MALEFKIFDDEYNITYKRGDTWPISITIKQAGAAIDITGWSGTLAVDPTKNPTDETTQLFKLVGTPDTDQTNNKGVMHFTPTAEQSNQTVDVKNYYDIEVTNVAGNSGTLVVGKTFKFVQDYSK